MPFTWITTQTPTIKEPDPLPNDTISVMVNLVSNTVNEGGTLLYNTAFEKYDVIYPSPGTSTCTHLTLVTVNIGNANFVTSTIGTMNVPYANITLANILSINSNSANINVLYSPLIYNGVVSADPTTALGIASKQYVDNVALLSGGGSGEEFPIGYISNFPSLPLPNGWLRLTTSSASRNIYSNLFSTIGTSYGSGDGKNTFGLPVWYNPVEGFQIANNSITIAQYRSPIVLLDDGRVLMVGGNTSTTATANTYFGNVSLNNIEWVQGTNLPVEKIDHRVVKLNDGRILVVGGGNVAAISTAQTWFGNISGTTITWTAGTPLPQPRRLHTCTILADNRILVTGGFDVVTKAESYFGTISGNTISWANGTNLTFSSHSHQASLTSDNSVIITGGIDTSSGIHSNVYVSRISGNSIVWTRINSLPNSRTSHSQITIPDGRILITGGTNPSDVPEMNVWFGMTSNSGVAWEKSLHLPERMTTHTMVALNDGRILINRGFRGVALSNCYFMKILVAGIKT